MTGAAFLLLNVQNKFKRETILSNVTYFNLKDLHSLSTHV